jgi:hypothetical protein
MKNKLEIRPIKVLEDHLEELKEKGCSRKTRLTFQRAICAILIYNLERK